MNIQNAKEILNKLPHNELILLIEKVMPMSGTYRQIDERGSWSDCQINTMAEMFVNSIDWEKRVKQDAISAYDVAYSVLGISSLGNQFGAIGNYSCEELVSIQDLERLNYPEHSN